jgi:predicted pyridoxine 5'-phosphate oxidase superfamily flavin-nucleotide-binding protein
MGSDRIWQGFKGHREFDRFTGDEAAFIADRDSFYMATVSETGWPYVQHRGGPRGFLKVVDDRTLAFADYRGNRQYISTGNLAADDRACLFLMDYPHRARLKIYAQVETLTLDDDPDLTAVVTMPDYKAKLERIFRLHLKAFDWNCQQHITPRFTEHEIAEAVRPLRDRLAQLEIRKRRATCSPYRKRRIPMNAQRPPLPPFTQESAVEKVRLAEDGWNSRDPEKVALAYTVDSYWRNRAVSCGAVRRSSLSSSASGSASSTIGSLRSSGPFGRTVSRCVLPMSGMTTAAIGFAPTATRIGSLTTTA